MAKAKKTVYILTANGPGTLGGPMGTEHEGGTIFTKPFSALKDAKAYVQKYVCEQGRCVLTAIDWHINTDGDYWSADALWVLFHIEKAVLG